MSSFIFENGNFISFKDYLLSESIKPKEIDFGTNYNYFDNKEIKNINSVILTSFKFNNLLYTVIIDSNNSVGFHFSEIPENEQNYLDIISVDSSSTDVRVGVSAIKTFSYVFFVILYMLKHNNKKEIKFDASHQKLGFVYDNMMNNKYFIQSLNSAGFEYKGKVNKEYVFKRI